MADYTGFLDATRALQGNPQKGTKASAPADISIQGKILKCTDARIGQYQLLYDNTVINVYSQDDEEYLPGSFVRVNVPEGKFENEKLIMGLVNKSAMIDNKTTTLFKELQTVFKFYKNTEAYERFIQLQSENQSIQLRSNIALTRDWHRNSSEYSTPYYGDVLSNYYYQDLQNGFDVINGANCLVLEFDITSKIDLQHCKRPDMTQSPNFRITFSAQQGEVTRGNEDEEDIWDKQGESVFSITGDDLQGNLANMDNYHQKQIFTIEEFPSLSLFFDNPRSINCSFSISNIDASYINGEDSIVTTNTVNDFCITIKNLKLTAAVAATLDEIKQGELILEDIQGTSFGNEQEETVDDEESQTFASLREGQEEYRPLKVYLRTNGKRYEYLREMGMSLYWFADNLMVTSSELQDVELSKLQSSYGGIRWQCLNRWLDSSDTNENNLITYYKDNRFPEAKFAGRGESGNKDDKNDRLQEYLYGEPDSISDSLRRAERYSVGESMVLSKSGRQFKCVLVQKDEILLESNIITIKNYNAEYDLTLQEGEKEPFNQWYYPTEDDHEPIVFLKVNDSINDNRFSDTVSSSLPYKIWTCYWYKDDTYIEGNLNKTKFDYKTFLNPSLLECGLAEFSLVDNKIKFRYIGKAEENIYYSKTGFKKESNGGSCNCPPPIWAITIESMSKFTIDTEEDKEIYLDTEIQRPINTDPSS